MSEFIHETVLLRETIDGVSPVSGGVYVDVTLGGGGHTQALLEASAPHGKVYGLDRDPNALAAARERLLPYGERVVLLHGRFSELTSLLLSVGVSRVQGVIADLGVSSPQLDHADRGFSFSRPGPLDMRMDPTAGEPLSELLQRFSTDELADILYEYGEERASRPIARSIKAALELGELLTTEDLRRTVVRVLGPRKGGADPATRTFQALRMAVNAETHELDALLLALPEVLADHGRAAVISFHSGEDRKVKYAFRDDPRLKPLTKRPLEAGDAESDLNPRARSAKLRVAERVPREELP